jgi:hypothetical protein
MTTFSFGVYIVTGKGRERHVLYCSIITVFVEEQASLKVHKHEII